MTIDFNIIIIAQFKDKFAYIYFDKIFYDDNIEMCLIRNLNLFFSMNDLIYILIPIVFFGLCLLYVKLCEKF
jgi:hypothetical protein